MNTPFWDSIELKGKTSGQHKFLCPACSHTRKNENKHEPCLSVDLDKGIYNCHNCQVAGKRELWQPQEYKKPVVLPKLNTTGISDVVFKYLNEERKLSNLTLQRNKITSSEKQGTHSMWFNYFVDGIHTNTKFRTLDKRFGQVPDAEKHFYKIDDIRNCKEAIVSEGEIDALSWEEAGFKNCVSIPDGAIAPNQKASDTKFSFVTNDIDRFANLERILIGMDNDVNGQAMLKELSRRFGRERCWILHFGIYKDANEVLQKLGREDGISRLKEIYTNAKPYPLAGVETIYGLADRLFEIYNNGIDRGAGIGYPELDEHIRWMAGWFYVITGLPTSGKALAIDTHIPTQEGWKSMEKISIGDVLFDEKGKQCRVTNITGVMHNRECYLLTFNDGTQIVADGDHQWLCDNEISRRSYRSSIIRGRAVERPLKNKGTDQSHKKSLPKVRTTKEISETVKFSKEKGVLINNYSINNALPIELEPKNFILHPYVLGAWLGDGCSASGNFTCADQHLIDIINGFGNVTTKQSHLYGYNIKGIIIQLRQLGVLKNKHIPIQYLRGSVEQRMDLLAGLMDTDGYASPTTGACEYCSVNKRLAEDVYELACSLGIKTALLVGNATLNGRFISLKYRVAFLCDWEVFKLKRKQNAPKRKRHNVRYIVSCEKVRSVPVKCIEVDSPSHLFLCTKSYIPTHNSNFLDQVMCRLMDKDWKFAVFSPEHSPELHMHRLAKIFTGKPFWGHNRLTEKDLLEVIGFFQERLFFIRPDNEDFTLDNVLKIAKQLVTRHGIKGLVIDPWNTLDHQTPKGMDKSDYISNALSKMNVFKVNNDCSIFLVAHPTKMQKNEDGTYKIPTGYNVADSAHFYNKPDIGITVYRNDEDKGGLVDVITWKIKFEGLVGKKGCVSFNFDKISNRYEEVNNYATAQPSHHEPKETKLSNT